MAQDRKKLQHIHSSVKNKVPSPGVLLPGEIAVNTNKDNEFLSIENASGVLTRFSSDLQLVDWMEKKEVVPVKGAVSANTSNNKSTIKINLNQKVGDSTPSATTLNQDSGFTIDTSSYALNGGNPTFSSLTVNNLTTLKGKTNISGETRIDNDLTVTGGTNISGNTKIGNGLNVTGATNISGATKITGNTTVNGKLNVTGDTTLKAVSATTISATTSVKSPLVSATTISGTNANITNLTADTENVTSLTATSGNVTNLTANTISGGSATISGALNVSGNTRINKNLTVSGNTYISGSTTIKGNTNISGDTKLQKLSATTANVTNLYATGNISGSSLSGSTLNVSSNTTLNKVTANTISASSISTASIDIKGGLSHSITFFSGYTPSITKPVFNGSADTKVTIPTVSGYPDKAEYNPTDKKIYFKHNDTILSLMTIDATDFIKDGMIESVSIVHGTWNGDKFTENPAGPDVALKIVWNLDGSSGSTKDTIYLNIGNLFDPSNYYTTGQTSGATQIANALAAKQDVLTVGRAIKISNNKISLNLPISAGTGTNSIIEGYNTVASGPYSHAEGASSQATGYYSHAEGSGAQASGDFSHAEGRITHASGESSHAEGQYAFAYGNYSHAEGMNTKASGDYSHAEGSGTSASSLASHAEGQGTTASGQYSHAEGSGTTASGNISHAEGRDTIASGASSHAEGKGTHASGSYSHAEGYETKASGSQSHAEGSSTKASGTCAHAEGAGTQAIGFYSHAEGFNTKASGERSHAEGQYTTAATDYSHAEGFGTKASGAQSHAEGYNTETKNESEHASGQYNVSSSASTIFGGSGNTLFSVGNGTSTTNRKNAFEIRQNGDIYITSGNTTIKLQDNLNAGGGTFDPTQYYTKSETSGATQIANALAAKANKATTLSGYGITNAYTKSELTGSSTTVVVAKASSASTAASANSVAWANVSGKPGVVSSTANGFAPKTVSAASSTIATQASEFVLTTTSGGTPTWRKLPANAFKNTTYSAGTAINVTNNVISLNLPISAGTVTNAIVENNSSNKASGDFSHAEGYFTTASGDYSHAEGWYTKAIGESSHAEGEDTSAMTNYSHAEGSGTTASGIASHAEGRLAKARGNSSHAEGRSTEAIGSFSHAEGYHTETKNQSEHASGQYNVSSSASTTFGNSGNTLFSVGNGTSTSDRKNAFEIRQNGDIHITSGSSNMKLQDHIVTSTDKTNLVSLGMMSATADKTATLPDGYVTVNANDGLFQLIKIPGNCNIDSAHITNMRRGQKLLLAFNTSSGLLNEAKLTIKGTNTNTVTKTGGDVQITVPFSNNGFVMVEVVKLIDTPSSEAPSVLYFVEL